MKELHWMKFHFHIFVSDSIMWKIYCDSKCRCTVNTSVGGLLILTIQLGNKIKSFQSSIALTFWLKGTIDGQNLLFPKEELELQDWYINHEIYNSAQTSSSNTKLSCRLKPNTWIIPMTLHSIQCLSNNAIW